MEKFLNFERLEVSGATKEEALEKAPFGIQGDATQAYRNFRKQVGDRWTDRDMKAFMLQYLEKKSKNLPGVGFYITLESAVADTRERPYRFKDADPSEGTRKYVRTYQIVDNATGAVIAETSAQQVQEIDKEGNPVLNEDGTPKMVWKAGTKAEAKELVRSLYTDRGFRGNVTCVCNKQIVEGNAVVFTAEYTPSKSARPGTYLVFGIKNI